LKQNYMMPGFKTREIPAYPGEGKQSHRVDTESMTVVLQQLIRWSAYSLGLLLLGSLLACGGGSPAPAPAPPPPAPSPSPAPTPTPAGVDLGAVTRVDPGSPWADDWRSGAFMQIFVRSYQDSDGDGIGDLRGLIQRLDYLRDLGVKGIWLLPIQRSQDGDHGYAVVNYRDIEPAYGQLADLDELLRQAHARGIGVVLDYVINHSAAQHPLFQASRADATNSFRAWYVWQGSVPAGWSVFGGNPWRSSASGAYYAPFWDQMPDWNLREPAVIDFHRHNLRFWLNRGVDGFRLDAVGMLFENGAAAWENQAENWSYLRTVADELDAYQRRLLICEAPSAVASAAGACGRAFAFGTQSLLIAAAGGNTTALQTLAATAAAGSLSPFLSNHDEFAGQRPFNQLGGDLGSLKLAASLSLLREGTPFIYYGEEIGMGGGAGLTGDPRLRSPMSWTADPLHAGFSTRAPYRALAANAGTHNVAAQQVEPGSLLKHYQALLALRNAEPALARGSTVATQASGAVFSQRRELGNDRLLVVVHVGRSLLAGATIAGLPANAMLQRRFGDGAATVATDAQGRLLLDLAAQSTHVFKLPSP